MSLYIDKTDETSCSSLQGHITITYFELLEELGAPHFTDEDKITAEWAFKSAGGVVFTIYDYKEDQTPEHAYSWHIGGFDQEAVAVVREIFPDHFVEGR